MTLLLSFSTSLIGCSGTTTGHTNPSTFTTLAVSTTPKIGAVNGNIKSVDNDGCKTVMDGLVKDGTITMAQEVAIRSIITTAKEDGTITQDQEIFKNQ